jgi:hypothetical protein
MSNTSVLQQSFELLRLEFEARRCAICHSTKCDAVAFVSESHLPLLPMHPHGTVVFKPIFTQYEIIAFY